MVKRFPLLSWWPALAALVVLLLIVGRSLAWSLQLNDGQLVYALDDAYIHMSIAKNMAQHGVWGVTQYAYTSASSSPLWTGLLALIYFLIEPLEEIPLLLNLLFAVGVIFAGERFLRRRQVPALYRFILLIAVVALTPLETLILAGMEHILQILLVILFVDEAADFFARPVQPRLTSSASLRLLVLGALLVATRYEGLFLVALFCLLFALRLRLIDALLLGIVSAAPMVIYGLIALANGWEFLPTSLLLKTSVSQQLAGASLGELRVYFIDQPLGVLADHVMTLPLVASFFLFLFVYEKRRSPWDGGLALLVAFMGAVYLNVRFVSWPFAGPLGRYEAYLIALGLLALPASVGAFLPRRVTLFSLPAYLITFIMLLFVLRDVYVRYRTLIFVTPAVTATENIYWQQMQMARFLDAYYPGAVVAANDIGAINYFADLRLVDLYGLGTIEIARAKQSNTYSTETLRQVTTEQGAQIAVIYEPWYEPYGGVPPEWMLVGRWALPPEKNVVLGYHEVSFYAIDPLYADPLREHLREFADQLPESVQIALRE
ncbi:MAG: hypothetical protein SF029_15780 [bacterium]|nr:hypothetical protein [bacterium]